MTLRDLLDKVLVANGADVVQNQGLHSWRCEYPDRYGQCSCYMIMLDELVMAVTTWDEGNK